MWIDAQQKHAAGLNDYLFLEANCLTENSCVLGLTKDFPSGDSKKEHFFATTERM